MKTDETSYENVIKTVTVAFSLLKCNPMNIKPSNKNVCQCLFPCLLMKPWSIITLITPEDSISLIAIYGGYNYLYDSDDAILQAGKPLGELTLKELDAFLQNIILFSGLLTVKIIFLHDASPVRLIINKHCCYWWHGGSSEANSSKLLNTLRPRQNGRYFPDDTFKRIFLNENVRISIKISLKFVPKGPIDHIPALVQIMAWRRPGDKPFSEPMMIS